MIEHPNYMKECSINVRNTQKIIPIKIIIKH